MQSKTTGPVAAFDSSMSQPVIGDFTALQMTEETTFTVLEPMFPIDNTEAVALTDLTYPPLFMLENIKSFQVATGKLLAFGQPRLT